MLNELIRLHFICPVCGRILYKPLKGYWCPFCGVDLNYNEPQEVDFSTERLTKRVENGMPYYVGTFTHRAACFPQDMSLSAIAEVLEKLAQYEDAEEKEEATNDESEP